MVLLSSNFWTKDTWFELAEFAFLRVWLVVHSTSGSRALVHQAIELESRPTRSLRAKLSRCSSLALRNFVLQAMNTVNEVTDRFLRMVGVYTEDLKKRWALALDNNYSSHEIIIELYM